jgi:hypothetical protein
MYVPVVDTIPFNKGQPDNCIDKGLILQSGGISFESIEGYKLN